MAQQQTILLLLVIASPSMVTASWPVGLKEFLSQKYLTSTPALLNYNISSILPIECDKISDNNYSIKIGAEATIKELGKGYVDVKVEFYMFVFKDSSLKYENVRRDNFAIYYVGDLYCPQYHLRHAMLSKTKNDLNTEFEISFSGNNIPESKLMEDSTLSAKKGQNWAINLLEIFKLISENVEITASSYMVSKTKEKPEYMGVMFKKSKIGMNKESIIFIPYKLHSPETEISNKYGIAPYIPDWTSHTPGTEEPTAFAELLSLFTFKFGKPISFQIITKTKMHAICLYSELWILEFEYGDGKNASKHCFVAKLPKNIKQLPPLLGERIVGIKQGLAAGNYTANAIMDFDQIDTSFDPEVKAKIWTSINTMLFIRFQVSGLFEYKFTGISGVLSANESLKKYVWIFELQKVPSDSIRAKYFGVLVKLCNHTKELSAVAIGHFSRSIVTIFSTPRRMFFSRGLRWVESFGAKLMFYENEPSKGLIARFLKKHKKKSRWDEDEFKKSMQKRLPAGNFESIPLCSCYGTFLANNKAKMNEYLVFENLQNGSKRYFIVELVPDSGMVHGYVSSINSNVFRTSEEAEDYISEAALPTAPTFCNS